MLVHGIHGDRLIEPYFFIEELEVYGVHWEGLYDSHLLNAHEANNTIDEGHNSWIGRSGPPEQLSDVPVDPPEGIFLPHDIDLVLNHVQQWLINTENNSIFNAWTRGLAVARTIYHHLL